jgi:hypothetical protein
VILKNPGGAIPSGFLFFGGAPGAYSKNIALQNRTNLFQKVKILSASMAISYKSSIQPIGHVLDPTKPWDFMQTPQT